MYWEKAGKENTKKTAELAIQEAEKRGIDYIVVATTNGDTPEYFKGTKQKVIVVTHVSGYKKPGELEVPEEKVNDFKSNGMEVLTSTHVLSGAERSISRKFGGLYPVEAMAHSLRMLGQGVKVCVEIAVMALDANLIPYDKEVIAVGGTVTGADTAVVIKPGHGINIFDTWISEIICKPKTKKMQ